MSSGVANSMLRCSFDTWRSFSASTWASSINLRASVLLPVFVPVSVHVCVPVAACDSVCPDANALAPFYGQETPPSTILPSSSFASFYKAVSSLRLLLACFWPKSTRTASHQLLLSTANCIALAWAAFVLVHWQMPVQLINCSTVPQFNH